MSLEELKGNPQAGKVSISHQQAAVARFAWAWGAAGAKFSSGGRGARYRRSDVKSRQDETQIADKEETKEDNK